MGFFFGANTCQLAVVDFKGSILTSQKNNILTNESHCKGLRHGVGNAVGTSDRRLLTWTKQYRHWFGVPGLEFKVLALELTDGVTGLSTSLGYNVLISKIRNNNNNSILGYCANELK